MPEDNILSTSGLTKEFAGFTAVNGVDLNVRRGSIHALIGPNGAGKTTCFNLLTKFLPPTRGTILYNGRDITREKPAEIARQRKRGDSFDFWRSERTLKSLDDEARNLVDAVGLTPFLSLTAGELSYG